MIIDCTIHYASAKPCTRSRNHSCKDYFASSGPQSLESIFQHETIPVCDYYSDDKLLPNCAAIVALHPDEATGVIVETALKYRIPFVVV